MKLNLPFRAVCLIALALAGGHAMAQAPQQEARNVQIRSLDDFEGADQTAAWQFSNAIRIVGTQRGATHGKGALELTCVSAETCPDDADRRAFLNCSPLLDASSFTRLAFDVTNPGTQPASVYMTLYNPGANSDWGYDGGGGRVPPGETRTIALDLFKLGRALQPMMDISRLSRLGVGVAQRPHEDATVILDHIRLELDPAVGSPTSRLRAQALQLRQAYQAAVARVPWDQATPQSRASLQELGDGLLAQVAQVVAACEKAEREGGFAGTYHEVNRQLHDLREANAIGRLLLVGKPAFHAWQTSPYVNILKEEYPAPDSLALKRLDVTMAGQEYRDTVFMISANADADQQIEVSLETKDQALKATTLVQEALYLKNAADQIVGGAHYRLEGPLVIPQGQSRQIRLRFDSHGKGLAAGRHDFAIRLRDKAHKLDQVIPGSVQVWDFALPDPNAIMSNDTYPEFCNSGMADLADLMVKDMRAYGLNAFFVHPLDIAPRDAAGNPHFTFENLDRFVSLVMDNWGPGPHPQFIFSLGYGISPGEADLGAWVQQFQAVLSKHGIGAGEWYFVFGDEATEKLLLSFELPLGEMMRRAAPPARISTNTSAMISDPAARERYFKTIDRWEPDLDEIRMNPDLLPYLRPTGKPINLFRCRGAYSVRGANMYNYYRVYGWEAAREGCGGMGLWTYCVDNRKDPWTDRENQFVLVFRHPTKRDLVHSRRYEAYREGLDDYRYIWKLRDVAKAQGPAVVAAVEKLIQQAAADITADVSDTTRCGKWRGRIAQEILRRQGARNAH